MGPIFRNGRVGTSVGRHQQMAVNNQNIFSEVIKIFLGNYGMGFGLNQCTNDYLFLTELNIEYYSPQ